MSEVMHASEERLGTLADSVLANERSLAGVAAEIEGVHAAVRSKQDALSSAQMAAVNSGITAEKVAQIGAAASRNYVDGAIAEAVGNAASALEDTL